MEKTMTERRQYTGTQRLQIGWSVGIFGVAALTLGGGWVLGLSVSPVVTVLLGSVAWLAGLSFLGLRERRQWSTMVEQSSFAPQKGPHTADLEKIVEGRSVTVSTSVPGILSQTHTEVRTTVADVEASFTITFESGRADSSKPAVTTGHEELDQQFVFQGAEGNIAKVLSPEVRSAVLSVQTPGVGTVTGEYVSFEMPFTSFSAEELEQIAQALVVIADRVESVSDTNSK